MNDVMLWTEKYRPKTVQDTILPANIKTIFQSFVDKKFIPNILLTGASGLGKTTIAKAMMDELDIEYIDLNASLERNIDTLRTTVSRFATSVSIYGGRKMILLDEADYLNADSFQPGLRKVMEDCANNCGFILTCNFPNRIIEAVQSRCSIIEFAIPKKQAAIMAKEFFDVVLKILDTEGVKYEKPAVAAVIERDYPDWRHILNELQKFAASGSIDSGALSKTANIKALVGLLKDKNFTGVRSWVAEHTDNDVTSIFRSFYDTASEHFTQQTIPVLIMLIAKYQYQVAFVADQEINLAAFFVEVMSECAFK